jgi:thymidine kinase
VSSVAKVYFRYGAMNSGKSTALLQAAHNYEERGHRVILAKPLVDSKGDRTIVSRLGFSREVDVVIGPATDVVTLIDNEAERILRETRSVVSCVLVDESQFLSPRQVDDLFIIAVRRGIPILAYGIRTDFQTVAFPGSRRLLEIAHSLEELKTICRCGKKAIFNARKAGEKFVFDGAQVAIDGVDAHYESLCGDCYLGESGGRLASGYQPPGDVVEVSGPDSDFS